MPCIPEAHDSGSKQDCWQYFEIERDKLTPLPLRRMEPIRQVIATCNAFSTIRFETNRYSVPVEYVGKDLTVKASVFEVSYGTVARKLPGTPPLRAGRRQVYLEHYLPLLEKKPRAVWNAQPVKAINLPAAFWDFAHKLGSDYEVVKLLKLLSRYALERF